MFWPLAGRDLVSPTSICGRFRRWTSTAEPVAAVDLFVDRATGVVAGFELRIRPNRSAAVEICSRLDGIPLAIELAASRMASMSVSEVKDRLGQRFRLLVGSRRGLERHQTLRHTVEWSFDLLDADERGLLQRCSVFAGGFDSRRCPCGRCGGFRRVRGARPSRRAGAKVTARYASALGPHEVLDAGDHPSVRRRATCSERRRRGCPNGARGLFRRTRARTRRVVEQLAAARRRTTGSAPNCQSANSLPVGGRRITVGGCGHHCDLLAVSRPLPSRTSNRWRGRRN